MTAPDVERFHVRLIHRDDTRTEASMQDHTYVGEYSVFVARPEDGAPPRRVRLRCSSCRETLEYRVYSRAATDQRLRLWKACLALCVAVGVFGVGTLIALGDDVLDDALLALLGLWGMALVGACGTVVFANAGWGEIGVAGPGMFNAGGVTKHKAVIESDDTGASHD